MIQICFPIKPVACQSVKFMKNGHAYQPKPKMAYKKTIAQIAKLRMGSTPPTTKPLIVRLWFEYATAKKQSMGAFKTTRPDIDNLLKGFLDALNGIVWQDDAQICRISASKNYGEKDAIYLEIEEI